MILKNVRSFLNGLKRRQPYRHNGGTRRVYRSMVLTLFILVVVVFFTSPRVKRFEDNNTQKKPLREALVSIVNCHGVIFHPHRQHRKYKSTMDLF